MNIAFTCYIILIFLLFILPCIVSNFIVKQITCPYSSILFYLTILIQRQSWKVLCYMSYCEWLCTWQKMLISMLNYLMGRIAKQINWIVYIHSKRIEMIDLFSTLSYHARGIGRAWICSLEMLRATNWLWWDHNRGTEVLLSFTAKFTVGCSQSNNNRSNFFFVVYTFSVILWQDLWVFKILTLHIFPLCVCLTFALLKCSASFLWPFVWLRHLSSATQGISITSHTLATVEG